MSESCSKDDTFLTQNDLDNLSKLVEIPVLQQAARKHLIAFNIDMLYKIDQLENRQKIHGTEYTRILLESYNHIKSKLDQTPETEGFAVSVKGAQPTTYEPTIETWLHYNKAKGDALALIMQDMEKKGLEPHFSLSEVYYIENDRYYSGGEKLTLWYNKK